MDLVDFMIVDFMKDRISPFDESCIQPNSYDVHLGSSFIRFSLFEYRDGSRTERLIAVPEYPVDIRDPLMLDKLKTAGIVTEFEAPYIIIYPGDFVLATTVETIDLPDFIRAQIDGKSSIARLGVAIHQTGGFIDAGFSGQITLEISNVLPIPIKIYAGDPIAQISFTKTVPCETPYNKRVGAKYMGQSGATASMYHKNF